MSVPGAGLTARDPGPGLLYSEVLLVEGVQRWYQALRGLTGATLAILSMFIVVPLVNAVVLQVSWQVVGSPGEYAEFARAGVAYQHPAGMIAAHLGLATLIPLTLLVVRYFHQVRPGWLVSVRPGLRWRYLLVNLAVATVVLNLVLIASVWGQGWELRPQPGFGWFLVAIILTSPLQAAAEEFLFRGYLMQALAPVGGAWFGVVASALIFAAFHGAQNLPLFLDRFGFGLLAGVLVVRTGGLEAAIAAHVVNNVFAFGYAGLTSTIAEVKATQVIGWGEAAWDLVGFAAFAGCSWWLARRLGVQTRTGQKGQTLPGLATGSRF